MVNHSSSRQFPTVVFSLFLTDDVSYLVLYVNVTCQESTVFLLESDRNVVVAVFVSTAKRTKQSWSQRGQLEEASMSWQSYPLPENMNLCS